MNDRGELLSIQETKNIMKRGGEAVVDGRTNDPESLISMNFWCYPVSFPDYLEKHFPAFHDSMKNPLKDEYLLPIIADGMLKEGFSYEVQQ